MSEYALDRFVKAQEQDYDRALAELLAEAEAYLRHPILRRRLVECVEAVLAVEGRSAAAIFGAPDNLKLKSCATLFDLVSPKHSVFDRLLATYYDGERDRVTVDAVRSHVDR
jgi:uncharacterized protein (DUF1810 family)